MPTTQSEFDQLQAEIREGGVTAVLERLAERLREGKRYHELFEALKMRVRHRIGLPLLYSDKADELDESQRQQLEEGLLDACRETGLLLLQEGAVREGWMYLRPVDNREEAAQAIRAIEVSDDNLDEIVEVTLHEGVDPERGFSLVLENYGLCNAITTFESLMHQRAKEDQRGAAAQLLAHVHRELTASVRADIARQQGAEPAETTLRELVADREWLFGEHSYHLDTTHLAATVRFARLLDEEEHLRLALDLTEYGRRLSKQFQYAGEEPFADVYPSHGLFFAALLGENVEEAVAYFRNKAESNEAGDYGAAVSVEVYIDLLARLGRFDEAQQAAITLTPQGAPRLGIAPSLIELSEKAGRYDRFLDHCRTRDDLLGFAAGLIQANK